MGAAQSTHADDAVNKGTSCSCAAGNDASGKSTKNDEALFLKVDHESDDEEDSDDDNDNEWFEQRLLILQDARKLRQVAEFFLCPEKPVQVDPLTTSRCYFSRYSAPEQRQSEEEIERDLILEDMKAMKKLAVDYLHPELPVVTTDPFACGRNYFTRPSAVLPSEDEEVIERDQILADMKAMKKLAVDFLHPELPVVTTDPFACGRNYFTRPSAVLPSDVDAEDEREQVLADMKAMKKLAVDYLHPELPVVTTDPFACGRNYFTRPSADLPSGGEEEAEREQILADMKAMKKLAVDYLHPEVPVVSTDPFACGRNYFTRPSADLPSVEDAAEREQILADMKVMKKLAVDYLHPELPVVTTDPCACGRNYFTRSSAVLPSEFEVEVERQQILTEMKAMKKLAVDYLHPELPVVTTDSFACGRNYFTRPSAVLPSEFEVEVEREQILADMKAMKKLAVDYLNPELPVVTTDPCACGRNYFTRPSAVVDENSPLDEVDEEERYALLEDLHWMKTLVNGFMHPELPVDYSGVFVDATKNSYAEEAEGHFDMDEDITVSYPAPQVHVQPIKRHSSTPENGGHLPDGEGASLAFSPDCVMMVR